ncbi:MAG: hypothetical protein ACR2RE_03495 [Geminicoccaceae bacterium]
MRPGSVVERSRGMHITWFPQLTPGAHGCGHFLEVLVIAVNEAAVALGGIPMG